LGLRVFTVKEAHAAFLPHPFIASKAHQKHKASLMKASNISGAAGMVKTYA
jgi:hypothetical protein